jgi:hypothetical protein
MFSAVASIIASRRASGLLGARRAHFASLNTRCVLPVTVNPAISVFATPSGAACWTQRGSCARRGCGLALRVMNGVPESSLCTVAGRSSCPSGERRSRARHSPSGIAFAVELGPNPAVNRTPAGVAASGERLIGAGYLTR